LASPAIAPDPFQDIRPYRDDEVPAVISRLLDHAELRAMMARLRYPKLPRWCVPLLSPLVRRYLAREFGDLRSVAELQQRLEPYLAGVLQRTTTRFTVSGLDRLDLARPHLFVSNHRDIAMDPALVNYALHREGADTVRIAIGDNLLTRDYASDLMRLNKSFIVRRSARGPRQMLAAYKQLSAYIEHSIVSDRAPVWIAQREGRAKDGWDRTEVAVLKMLTMNRDRGTPLGDYLRRLRVVPVAISYELDPCDAVKAAELCERERSGDYEKADDEDLRNIGAGITGAKGAVHVAFGDLLDGEFADAEAAAAAIDRQVVAAYRLPASSGYAWESLHGEWPVEVGEGRDDAAAREHFRARIDAMPEAHRAYALRMYANPISNRRELLS
jgi:hypothetical protein